jgi:hypothetical protein
MKLRDRERVNPNWIIQYRSRCVPSESHSIFQTDLSALPTCDLKVRQSPLTRRTGDRLKILSVQPRRVKSKKKKKTQIYIYWQFGADGEKNSSHMSTSHPTSFIQNSNHMSPVNIIASPHKTWTSGGKNMLIGERLFGARECGRQHSST